jgi:tRNA threonylcarbamoyladenosine modification (KEOPS) complex  Pcc1 subunit
MKTLALLLLALNALPAFAGGSSTVGPPGPSGLATKAFYNDANVQNEIQGALRAGFSLGRDDLSGTEFLRHENCRVPNKDATFTVCDFVFLVVRALERPEDGAVVKVSRVVIWGMDVHRVLPNQGGRFILAREVASEYSAEAIYEALAVIAEDPRPLVDGMPPMGAMVLQKSVGGLACRKSTVFSPGGRTKIVCQLNEEANAEAIYEALNLEEVDARPVSDGMPSLGAMIWEKAVGGLACRKVQVVYPGAPKKFSCSLNQ